MAGVLTLITGLLFWRGLHASFVDYDDLELVLFNKAVAQFSLKDIFFNFAAEDYLPLTFLTYAVEHAFFNWDPYYFHLVNLCLHILNSILVMVLARKLSNNNFFVTAFTAILFAIHPFHVEPVAWVSGRKDLLCTLFFILGLLAYLDYIQASGEDRRRRTTKYILTLVFFIFSFLSKATAAAFLAVMVFSDWLYQVRMTRRTLIEKIPFFAVTLILTIVHMNLHKRHGGSVDLTNILDSLVFYLSKSLVPTALSVYYESGAVNISAAQYVLVLLILLIFGIIIKTNPRSRPHVIFGGLFFLANIALVLKIIPFGSEFIYADRYMYLPSIGLFYAFAVCLDTLRTRSALYGAAAATFGAYAFLSFNLVDTWQNTEVLWKNVIQHYPKSSNAHTNLGVYYFDHGNPGEAEALFRKAIELNPKAISAETNLATLDIGKGLYAEAKFLLDQALKEDPLDSTVHYVSGEWYFSQGLWDQALVEYNKSLELQPHYRAAEAKLVQTYAKLNQLGRVREILFQILADDPNNLDANINLGNLYFYQGELAQAETQYLKVIRAYPQNKDAYLGLSKVYVKQGRTEEAKKLTQLAEKLQ